MFVWLALWAIGCAPALINYNLKGEALLHSLQNSGSSLVLVDPEISAAVLELQEIINGELNMKVAILDARLKTEIGNLEPKRPDDRYRAEVKGSDNQALIYTRWV
jgi:acyl-coenzyme A synthetase/AMP-(fatty) acid ligase